jgi:hypothetical protein
MDEHRSSGVHDDAAHTFSNRVVLWSIGHRVCLVDIFMGFTVEACGCAGTCAVLSITAMQGCHWRELFGSVPKINASGIMTV